MTFGYQIAAGQILARAANQGRSTMPLGVLVAAHAADVLDPGQLSLDQVQLAYRGTVFTSVHQLAPILAVPGVRFQTPTVANTDGTISTLAPGDVITSDFHYTDLAQLYGSTLVDYIDALIDLWKNKMAPLGALTDFQLGRVLLLLRSGVIVVPASPLYLANLGYPTGLRSVAPQFQAAWTLAIAAFKPANDAYAAGNYALAVSAARAAALNVAIWEGVYAAVTQLHELPATIATGLGAAAGDIAGAFGWKNWLVIGGVVAAILIVRSLPGAAARTLVKAA